MRRLYKIVLPLIIIMLIGAVAVQAAGTKMEIVLSGPDANGKARFEDRGDELRFRVEVEDAQALAGETLDVNVDGNLAGSMTIDGLGDGRLSLNSDLGDTVPIIAAGSSITVETAGGTIVVSGVF